MGRGFQKYSRKKAFVSKLTAGQLLYFPTGYVILQHTIEPSVLLKWSVFVQSDPKELERVRSSSLALLASYPALGHGEFQAFVSILQEQCALQRKA